MNTARTPKQLGLLLQGHRKEESLSQEKAAGRVGLSQKMVSAFENHPERCSIGNLFKLLSALDLELSLKKKNRGPAHPGEW
ncbi:helix-turn-helix domain-containing protein [Chlorobium sp. N1]|uniref:helix-turn-helix domain-containing protein n=1 Tax=Chlorobium sp. N1 TaxID=2491138 RepID=UPI00104058E8|nr:helix-turn-helix domain-containing protein [Chlorobium sp. N1]TCD48110.1 helix-turn-helix domain-containing protein [Chlorobium sp. N1]